MDLSPLFRWTFSPCESLYFTHLDGLGIKLQPFLLVHQEFLNIFALIALKLNHLAHLSVVDDGAIASWASKSRQFLRPKTHVGHRWLKLTKLLLDNLEDLLLVELLWETLDSCQGLTTIALYRA